MGASRSAGRAFARALVLVVGCGVIALALSASPAAADGSFARGPSIVCGIALVLLALGRVAVPTGLAFVAATWTLVVVGRLGPSAGPPDAPLGPPVRVSLLTPAAIALTGLGLLHFPLLPTATALCGVCVSAIGVFQLLLVLDAGGLAQSIGVRPEHVTPLPLTGLVICLGLGVVTAAAGLRPAAPRRLGYAWAPFAATAVLVIGSLVLWQTLVHLQMRDLRHLTRSAASVVSANLLREIYAIGSVLDVLASRAPEPARAWTQEADVLRRTSAGVLALAFVDSDLDSERIWVTPDHTEPPPLSLEDRALLRRASGAHSLIVTHVSPRSDGRPIARIALPRIRADRTSGFVTAIVDVGALTEEKVASALQDYAVRLRIDGARPLDYGIPGAPWDDPVVQRRTIPLPGGTEWLLLVSPSRALQRTTRTVLPEIVLASTLLLALLLGSTLALARATASQAATLAREVDQRERAEQEIRAMAQDLERRVQERTEELRLANAGLALENAMRRRAELNLRRSNDDLRQFAAFVSHELRQPLSTIGIWSELLGSSEPPLGEKQRRHLAKIRDSVTRMARLIESELTLAQLSHGELPREQVALATLVNDVRSDMAPILEQAGARIEAGRLCKVLADPQQLRLLFRNLVENALKYRGDAPPIIRIEETAPEDPDVCEVTVRDNGRGFGPEMAERMFTMFDRSADHSVPGSGIGLAICRRIVERHGGRITAHGAVGAGATFVIQLPRAGGDLEVGPVPPAGSTGPHGGTSRAS